MLILCDVCINRIRKRGEKLEDFFSGDDLDGFAVCDVCGSDNLLSEVVFPDDK